MKKLLITAAVAAAFVAPAASARDKVTVEYNGQSEKMYMESIKEMSVCAFKRQVSEKFDIKMKKFDLKKSGTKLNEDKTLYGAYVRNNGKVQVVEKSHSNQC